MVEFLFVAAFFSSLAVIVYLPAFFKHCIAKRSERVFTQKLAYVNKLYERCIVIVTEKLGLGVSQNSDVKFCKAHNNQTVAINSVMSLMDTLYGVTEE